MPIHRREMLAGIGGGATIGLAGCTSSSDGGDDDEPEISGETITLTTTTSTYDTGLIDELNAPFEDRYGVTVDTVSQGTGAALETGRSGDSDVVMVHARSLEDEFIEDGYGVNRRDVMFNDFVVVGTSDDPAGITGGNDVEAALTTIAEKGATFVSRGDDSGTHAKELELWDAAGVGEFGEWYREAGQGMSEVIMQVGQTGDYTLADRGSFLSMQSEIDLDIHVEGPIEGGPELLANPYGIVAVNPAVHDGVEYDLSMAYIGYLTGPEGREIIEEYTLEGEQLFFPEAISEEPNFQQYVPEDWAPSEADD
ncbi:substrate-binding domain-containing protein [Natronococcus sp. A-GB1]|uniref:substrate-binding domain-containing protein n=1 Tax=Natronococcus sp. A-GB1 TaxID=3037648 RepID=UPI00241F2F0F|nr:substrate-binding domain-containing protein [Natronococcus sp. A-GB1]MDG5758997.1 substrate-binding domain-containing protein [Natronococcus sp. A-GB1]